VHGKGRSGVKHKYRSHVTVWMTCIVQERAAHHSVNHVDEQLSDRGWA
jgi:hypothetical protein